MNKIAIFGAGGFGREVASLIKRINKENPKWDLLGFYDDNPSTCDNEYGRYLGDMATLNTIDFPLSVVLAVGNPHALKKIKERILNPLIAFPNIIAPEASILDPDNYKIGQGNILGSFVSLSCNVTLGDFNVINNRTSFGHDASVGDYNVFMTASRISGSTQIGSENLFGVGSILLPGIKIGKNTIITPGSVVVRGTKDNNTYIGNPAKIFKF